MQMFRKQSDFEAFERVMVQAHLRQLGRWNGQRTGQLASSFDHEGMRPSALPLR
jgi:hypothetical protein